MQSVALASWLFVSSGAATSLQSCIDRLSVWRWLSSEPVSDCRFNARLKDIQLNSDGSVKCYRLADGSTVEGDLYVSAMPGEPLIWSNEHLSVCAELYALLLRHKFRPNLSTCCY